MRVTVQNSSRIFHAAPGQSLLDAALAAGLNLPHSCKGGQCGACRARLVGGEIEYPGGAPLGLSAGEVREAMILLCQAHTVGDVILETFEVRPAAQSFIKRLPCRIERAVQASHDVMQLFLRLPIAEDFHFEAGQYLDILLTQGRRRSFSIASPPHAARPLEIHVRRVSGGRFTDRLFHEDICDDLLNIEGPLGQFFYRASQAPLLMVGGGTGLAPLLGILRHVIDNGLVGERELHLYWGVRGEQDLYAQQTLENLCRKAPRLNYIPVLSAATPQYRGRTGWVHEAVLQDLGALDRFDIYMAGPPAMIEAARCAFEQHGAAPARIFFDSFAYASDSLDRHRNSAATKS